MEENVPAIIPTNIAKVNVKMERLPIISRKTTGRSVVTDENSDMVEDYEGAYIPEVLSIVEKGYGDYLEFYVTPAGDIEAWEYDINKKLYEQPQQNR